METKELYRKFATWVSPAEIERLREEKSGVYTATTFRNTRDFREILHDMGRAAALRLGREQTSLPDLSHNIVTNQGLAHVLSSTLDAGTQIGTWYLIMSSSNTATDPTMTASTPLFTEVDADDVTETIRETWTGGSVTGTTTASVDNAAAVATYTCDATGYTAWGAALIGGGTSAFGNTAGTLYSYSLFGTQKVMVSTDTIDVTYTFTATDS